MKYEKATVEVISFDGIEVFMDYSNGSGQPGQQNAYNQISNRCGGFSGSIDNSGNFTCSDFNHLGVGGAVIIKITVTGYQCLNFNNI